MLHEDRRDSSRPVVSYDRGLRTLKGGGARDIGGLGVG